MQLASHHQTRQVKEQHRVKRGQRSGANPEDSFHARKAARSLLARLRKTSIHKKTVRKQVFDAVDVPHLPKAEPIKKAEPELRKREREPLWHYSVTAMATCRPKGLR